MFAKKDRDKQWYEDLWRKYHGPVLQHCYRLLGEYRSEAQDLAQSTFLTAWDKRQKVPDEDPLTWLRRTARNHIRNFFDSPKVHRQRSVDFETLEALAHAEFDDLMRVTPERVDLQKYMEQLSRDERELLDLTHWRDLSTKEIAAYYGITDAAVRTRQHRARVALLRLLHEYNAIPSLCPPAAEDGDDHA